MRSITTHLKPLSEVYGLDELQPVDKQFIGSHVYEMLTDGDLIERNWEFCRAVSWYHNNEDVEVFWRWLDDPVAIAGLGPRDKRWLADIKKDGHHNSGLLTPVMTMVAKNWLRKTEWDSFAAYRWIRGFLSLGGKREEDQTDPVDEKVDSSDEGDGRIVINENDSMPEGIAKAEQWCKQSLNVAEPDYTWCIRLGDTYACVSMRDAASEHYKKAATILQAQEPVNKEQLRDVLKALGEWVTDPESALEYLEEAYKLDEENVEILHAMLQRHFASKKEAGVQSIIQKAVTEKVPGTESTLLIAMLTTAMNKQDESNMLSVFKAIFSQLSSYPQLSATFQREMGKAIETARTERKNEELAILLLLQGSTGYYLHKDSPDQLVTDAGHLRECLDTIQEKAAPEYRCRLESIKQSAVTHLSMFYLERAMQVDGDGSNADLEGLRQMYEDDPASIGPKSVLASLYIFKGQRDKARDVLRADMIEAFNILIDDDIVNDGDGLIMLRSILNHSGDYENALRAAFLFPKFDFDETILKELLAGKEETPSMESGSAELLRFYQKKCPNKYENWGNLNKVWKEASRLASKAEAEADSAMAAWYHRIENIFAKHESTIYWGYSCNTCERHWNYDNRLHTCKYCYNVNLCDICLQELQSGENTRNKAFICSSTHDWYELPVWTMEKYLRACQGLVQVKTNDGGAELVSVSRWLGILCEEWGLFKSDFDFE